MYTIGPADAPYSRAKRSTSVWTIPSSSKKAGGLRKAFESFTNEVLLARTRRTVSTSQDIKKEEMIVDIDKSLSSKGMVTSKGNTMESKYSVAKITNGTNMITICLMVDDSSEQSSSSSSITITVVIICGISLALLSVVVCVVLGFCIRKRKRRRKKETYRPQSAYPATINNLRNDFSKDVKYCSSKPHGKSHQGLGISKCNIIKAKEINILSKQGINVDSGTEV